MVPTSCVGTVRQNPTRGGRERQREAICSVCLRETERKMMKLIIPPVVSTEFTLFLTTLLLLLICLKPKRRNGKQILPLPPGPLGLPIIGSLPFLNPNLHHHFTDLARSYGHVLSLRLGSKLCVVISSPTAAREILKDQDAVFANRVVPAAALSYYGNSNLDILWSPCGPLWRLLRKISVHEMLSAASMEAVAPLRRQEMRRTVEEVRARAKLGAAVDVRETAFLTMLNMMTSMLLGERVGGGRNEKEFRRAIEEAIDLLMAPNVADFFPVVAPLDPQGLGRRMRELMAWVNKYLDGIVEKKKQKMARGERRKDVLEALLDFAETGSSQPPFTMDDLHKLLVDLIGGSTDNISVAVEWAMAELLRDPKKMRIAQQELDAVVGKHRVVEESDIPQLRYLSAVTKESLRLHPPLPLLIPHCPSSDSAVSGFSVPAGTTVFVNAWAIHRDTCLWGEDAEEFKPERFMETGMEKSDFYVGGNEFCYMPFGAGRRTCVGIAMGQKVVIYMLASLLHSFEWRSPAGASLELGDRFGTVLRKAERLFAVPTVRLEGSELYI